MKVIPPIYSLEKFISMEIEWKALKKKTAKVP